MCRWNVQIFGPLFSGMAMVGKGRNLRGKGLIWPLLIVLVKIGLTANLSRYYAVLTGVFVCFFVWVRERERERD